jgi:Ankyrin repeats (3 copies)
MVKHLLSSPLHIVDSDSLIDILLKNGANVNSRKKGGEGNTALMIACENGYTNIVSLILQTSTTRINLLNNNNQTALMIACKNGKKDVALKLLEKGADVDIIDYNGHTALSLCFYKYGIDDEAFDLASTIFDETSNKNKLRQFQTDGDLEQDFCTPFGLIIDKGDSWYTIERIMKTDIFKKFITFIFEIVNIDPRRREHNMHLILKQFCFFCDNIKRDRAGIIVKFFKDFFSDIEGFANSTDEDVKKYVEEYVTNLCNSLKSSVVENTTADLEPLVPLVEAEVSRKKQKTQKTQKTSSLQQVSPMPAVTTAIPLNDNLYQNYYAPGENSTGTRLSKRRRDGGSKHSKKNRHSKKIGFKKYNKTKRK